MLECPSRTLCHFFFFSSLYSNFFYDIINDIFVEHENAQTRIELIRKLYLGLKTTEDFGLEKKCAQLTENGLIIFSLT